MDLNKSIVFRLKYGEGEQLKDVMFALQTAMSNLKIVESGELYIACDPSSKEIQFALSVMGANKGATGPHASDKVERTTVYIASIKAEVFSIFGHPPDAVNITGEVTSKEDDEPYRQLFRPKQ